MIDDVEHRAWLPRPRDGRHGPFRLPDARTLGRRLAALRVDMGVTAAELAAAAGLWHAQIEEFEEHGLASAETLLWLMELLGSDGNLSTAFLPSSAGPTPPPRRGDNVVSLRPPRR